MDGRGYPQLCLELPSRRAAAFPLARIARRSGGADGGRGKTVRRSGDHVRFATMFEEAER